MLKRQKPSLKDLFDEDAKIIANALYRLADAIQAHCNNDRVSMAKYSDETIAIEKQQDRLAEQIIARMYSRETMVFSRADRIFIIKELDKIGDLAEFAVRKLLIYHPKPNNEINNLLEEMSKLIRTIGTEVRELVFELFDDFESAKKTVIHITDLRREVRRLEWASLERIFSLSLNYIEFRYYETNIMQIARVADEAESFADNLYVLICKYTLS